MKTELEKAREFVKQFPNSIYAKVCLFNAEMREINMLKFQKNGKLKAILKDGASEPEGIKYLEADLPDDFIIPEGVKSLEEIEAEDVIDTLPESLEEEKD